MFGEWFGDYMGDWFGDGLLYGGGTIGADRQAMVSTGQLMGAWF